MSTIISKDTIKEKLDSIMKASDNNIRMYFYTKDKKIFQPKLIESTFSLIGNSYINFLKEIIEKVAEISEFDLDGNLTSDLVYLNTSDETIPDYKNLLKLLEEDNHEVLEESMIKNFYNSIKAVVFVINEEIKIIKKFSYPKRLLAKNKVLSFKKYPLEQVQEDIFSLDSSVDIFEIDNIAYILNVYSFECIFSLETEYKKKVDESISLLESSELIKGVITFKEECLKNKNTSKRLLKLLNKNNFAILKEKKKELKKVISDYDLDIKLTDDGDINFSSGDNVGQILNLLGDNYYISSILEEKRLAKANQKL